MILDIPMTAVATALAALDVQVANSAEESPLRGKFKRAISDIEQALRTREARLIAQSNGQQAPALLRRQAE